MVRSRQLIPARHPSTPRFHLLSSPTNIPFFLFSSSMSFLLRLLRHLLRLHRLPISSFLKFLNIRSIGSCSQEKTRTRVGKRYRIGACRWNFATPILVIRRALRSRDLSVFPPGKTDSVGAIAPTINCQPGSEHRVSTPDLRFDGKLRYPSDALSSNESVRLYALTRRLYFSHRFASMPGYSVSL